MGLSAQDQGLRRLAEDLNAHAPQRRGEERLVTPRYVACLGPGAGPYRTVVQRLRLRPGEVDETVREVRAALAARGRRAATWEVGPSSTPTDLVERLYRLGMAPDEGEPVVAGMVLRGPPLVGESAGVTVRRVEGWDEYQRSCAILDRCFGVQGDEAERRAERAQGFAEYADGGPEARYLALIGGEAVAAGLALSTEAGVVLCGGATLPEARGRGAYRALVRARWRDAAALGSALVVQAGAMSRPILRRLGFVEVAEIRVLRDVMMGG